MKMLHDYTAIITDLSEMAVTGHGISEQTLKIDLRLLQGPFPELQALKQWVAEQKEPLTHGQLHQIRDDLMNQLYQLYKAKKRKSYPFTPEIFEDFMNRDLNFKGGFRELFPTKINPFGVSRYDLEEIAPS